MKWYRDRQPPFGNQIEMGDLPAYKDCMGNWRDKETNELLETKVFEEAFKDDSVNIEMSNATEMRPFVYYNSVKDKFYLSWYFAEEVHSPYLINLGLL